MTGNDAMRILRHTEYDPVNSGDHESFENKAETFWESLSREDKLKCFYAVCKRIHEGSSNGTYRYTLYEVFGFDPSAYVLGMDCGFVNIHNAIAEADITDEEDL